MRLWQLMLCTVLLMAGVVAVFGVIASRPPNLAQKICTSAPDAFDRKLCDERAR